MGIKIKGIDILSIPFFIKGLKGECIFLNERNQIKDIVEQISGVSNLFYQNKINEGYKDLEKLLGDFSLLLDGFYQSGILSMEDTVVLDILRNTMSAMEQGDTLLVADILEYELKDVLLELMNE